jgi:hypothetical protein
MSTPAEIDTVSTSVMLMPPSGAHYQRRAGIARSDPSYICRHRFRFVKNAGLPKGPDEKPEISPAARG